MVFLLKVTGYEVPHACRDEQIFTGLKAGINRAVHGFQYIWEANYTEEKLVFLLVDVKNAFNKIN